MYFPYIMYNMYNIWTVLIRCFYINIVFSRKMWQLTKDELDAYIWFTYFYLFINGRSCHISQKFQQKLIGIWKFGKALIVWRNNAGGDGPTVFLRWGWHWGWQFRCAGNFFLSNQGLYFVKENYEIFSTEVSARERQGQISGGPHQDVIGSLGISSTVRPFWICSPVGEHLNLNVLCRSRCIVQFLFLPSSCEVSLRKQFKKIPGKCRTSWICD